MSEPGFHAAFADHLAGRTTSLPGLDDPNSPGLAVYRNTVARNAISVLRDAYPAVCFLAGDRNFDALARDYWRAHPPTDGVLMRYGAGFADHMEAASPPGMPDILPVIARLDRAWTEAHLAANAVPLLASILTLRDVDALDRMTLRLHPSVRLPASVRTVYRTWSAARFEGRVERAGPSTGETVLVWRPQMEVRHRALEPVEARLIHALAGGLPLTAAAERAEATPEHFIRLLKDGVFARD